MIEIPLTEYADRSDLHALPVVVFGDVARIYESGDSLPNLNVSYEREMPGQPPLHGLSAADFRARFTDAELAAIAMLAYGGAGDVQAAVLLLKLQTSARIDQKNQAVVDGLNYLVSKNVLAAHRVLEITY